MVPRDFFVQMFCVVVLLAYLANVLIEGYIMGAIFKDYIGKRARWGNVVDVEMYLVLMDGNVEVYHMPKYDIVKKMQDARDRDPMWIKVEEYYKKQQMDHGGTKGWIDQIMDSPVYGYGIDDYGQDTKVEPMPGIGIMEQIWNRKPHEDIPTTAEGFALMYKKWARKNVI